MKEYLSLVLLVLLVGACQKVFSSGYPSDMPPLSKFLLADNGTGECGFREKITKYETADGIWLARYRENEQFPYVIIHARQGGGSEFVEQKFWVDKKSAGHVDEYIDNNPEFYAKYPHKCEAAAT